MLPSSTRSAKAEALVPICETGFAGQDVFSDTYTYDTNGHLDANDIYLRYASAEFLGSGTDSVTENYYVLGWVTGRDPATGLRALWVAMVRDWPPQPECRADAPPPNPSHPSPTTSFPLDVQDVVDVAWVHHGGHVPAGQVGKALYPSHGYLVWSSKGDEQTPPKVVVGRFWQQGGGLLHELLRLRRVGTPSHWDTDFAHGITPSMASNRPLPLNTSRRAT